MLKNFNNFLSVIFLFVCMQTAFAIYAPVVDATTIETIPENGIHIVAKGETFYSIAWRYGLNYQTLAIKNNIKPPYNIEIGEKIYLRDHVVKPEIIYADVTSFPKKNLHPKKLSFLQRLFNREPIAPVTKWRWPAHGEVVRGYSPFNKGINIIGKKGSPVYAAASGKIVYNGDGLRSYGNLIIIKHNSKFLTAYAHNTKTFVRQGEWVRAGQKIAEMGSTGTNRVMLHFEIRKNGAPVNPLIYLTSR